MEVGNAYECPSRFPIPMREHSDEVLGFWSRARSETGVEGELLGAWALGDSPGLADELLALVLKGEKRAATGLVVEMELRGEPEPRVGTYTIVLDGEGRPRALLRTVGIRRTTFDEVDEEHAYWEGEGDRTLESYRREHTRYFKRVGRKLGFEFTEGMAVVLERFELVYPMGDVKR